MAASMHLAPATFSLTSCSTRVRRMPTRANSAATNSPFSTTRAGTVKISRTFHTQCVSPVTASSTASTGSTHSFPHRSTILSPPSGRESSPPCAWAIFRAAGVGHYTANRLPHARGRGRASGRPFVSEYWPHITFFAALEVVVTVCVITWVLMTKRDSTAAMAWCLVVILVPLIGAFLLGVFGYQRLNRPLGKRRRHRLQFRSGHTTWSREASHGSRPDDAPSQTWNRLGELALQVNAFPVSPGNAVTLYDDTQKAFDALLEAIAAARHHVHLEFFIIRGDSTGQRVVDLLAEKVRQGVQVRLLYDAVGGFHLRRRVLRPLRDAGAKIDTFLPVTLAPFRFRVNLRNHRKITVIDGKVGFTGGMNIGDE